MAANPTHLAPGDLAYLVGKSANTWPDIYRFEYAQGGSAFLSTLAGSMVGPVLLQGCRKWQEPLRRAGPLEAHPAARVWLRLMARQLSTAARLGGGAGIKLLPLPHQLLTVQRFMELVESNAPRLLLADEPGLGKTTEAALIFTLLRRMDLARRPLFLVPPRLVSHWANHLASRFGHRNLPASRRLREIRRDVVARRKGICSIDAAKLEDLPGELATVPWDFIVVDEAHHLTLGTKRLALVSRLLAPAPSAEPPVVLLLSATPHSGHSQNFLALLSLLNRSVLDGKGGGDPAAISAREARELLRARGGAISRQISLHTRAEAINHRRELLFPTPEVRFVEVPDGGQAALERDLRSYCGRYKAAGLLHTSYRRMANSSLAALRQALEARIERARKKRAAFGDSAEEELRGAARFGRGDEVEAGLEQARAASRAEQAATRELLAKIPDGEADPKLDALLAVVQEQQARARPGDDRLLIFVEFKATQRHLQQQLERRFGDGCCALINGDMSAGESWRQLRRFEAGCQFMISTDAGSEGLDMQVCRAVVNYDLPWNPMRLEQRIGRAHRLGATGRLLVVNMVQTVQDQVFRALRAKITHLAGELGDVRGEGGHRLSAAQVEAQLLGIAAQSDELADLYEEAGGSGAAAREQELDAIMLRAREAWHDIQAIWGALPPPNVEALEEMASRARLGDTERFVARFVQTVDGSRLSAKQSPGPPPARTLAFGVPEQVHVPAAHAPQLGPRRRCDSYCVDYEAALLRDDLRLLAAGDPIFDAMLTHCFRPEFGGRVGKLAFSLLGVGRFSGVAVFYLLEWLIAGKHPMQRLLPVVIDQDFASRDDIAAALAQAPAVNLDSRASFEFAAAMLASSDRLLAAAERGMRRHPVVKELVHKGLIQRGDHSHWRQEALVMMTNVPGRGGEK